MGLFDKLKRRRTNEVKQEVETKSIKKVVKKEDRYRAIDKVDYQYEMAMKEYCKNFGKTEDSLTDKDIWEIYRYAGNHIGFFITWIIQNHFEGDIHKDIEEILEEVRSGELLGVDFLIKYCDSKFWGEDINDDIYGFVDNYYEEKYLEDYTKWVIDDMCDLPLEFVGTWKDYVRFKPIIDKAYNEYINNL